MQPSPGDGRLSTPKIRSQSSCSPPICERPPEGAICERAICEGAITRGYTRLRPPPSPSPPPAPPLPPTLPRLLTEGVVMGIISSSRRSEGAAVSPTRGSETAGSLGSSACTRWAPSWAPRSRKLAVLDGMPAFSIIEAAAAAASIFLPKLPALPLPLFASAPASRPLAQPLRASLPVRASRARQ